jgi:hypothetical protein
MGPLAPLQGQSLSPHSRSCARCDNLASLSLPLPPTHTQWGLSLFPPPVPSIEKVLEVGGAQREQGQPEVRCRRPSDTLRVTSAVSRAGVGAPMWGVEKPAKWMELPLDPTTMGM